MSNAEQLIDQFLDEQFSPQARAEMDAITKKVGSKKWQKFKGLIMHDKYSPKDAAKKAKIPDNLSSETIRVYKKHFKKK